MLNNVVDIITTVLWRTNFLIIILLLSGKGLGESDAAMIVKIKKYEGDCEEVDAERPIRNNFPNFIDKCGNGTILIVV
jgi:hypothetical protein